MAVTRYDEPVTSHSFPGEQGEEAATDEWGVIPANRDGRLKRANKERGGEKRPRKRC